MQSPELYGIVGGDECLLHLLKFQQRTSMKWYLITSLDDTSQVLSHFVHHYLHWILFHMTVVLLELQKKTLLKSPWRVCCAHPQASSTLEIEPGIWGISEIEPGSIAPRPDMIHQDPNLVAWGSALLHFLLDGSVTIVQLLDSLRNLCLALLPNGCSSTTGPTKLKSWQIFANVAPLSQVKPTNTKLLHFLQLLVLVLKAVLELHILMGHLRACRLGLQIASCSVFTAKILSGSLRSIVYRDESCVQKSHC